MSPAIPVVEIAPPVTARPCSAVAPFELGPGEPALRAHRAARGIDVGALHLGEVDHHGAVGDRAPGHVVATAADADVEPGRAREAHAGSGVLRAAAAHDDRGRPIDKAVVDPAGRVVAVVRRPQDAPGEAAGEVVEECGVGHATVHHPRCLPRRY